METKFTPGPWTVREGIFIDSPAMKQLAHLRGTEANPVTRATARLIASAPELYAALKQIRDARDNAAEGYPTHVPDLDDEGREFDDWAADVASGALAKAEGSKP